MSCTGRQILEMSGTEAAHMDMPETDSVTHIKNQTNIVIFILSSGSEDYIMIQESKVWYLLTPT